MTEHEIQTSVTMSEEISEDTIELAAKTLTGDVRDAMLDRIKNLRKPWQQCSQQEQTDLIVGIQDAAEYLVRQAVQIIASEGRKVITGQLESVNVKKEIKATITLPKTDPCRHELVDSQGQFVLIVVAEVEPFIGQRRAANADPDQPTLFGGENDSEIAEQIAEENNAALTSGGILSEEDNETVEFPEEEETSGKSRKKKAA